ncbi:linalool dehydratase/isomerase domain-containing protein [Mycolicibacterium vinylchloridicum]|uniref:linalool dehydratase/isomerase domain-containing protein n=1 Tax=Mycolicibacterium vinylchloridicum TaxID=2736928 RepID=UPI0015C90A39|nr:hypothetical protein [Mycolicibacterium vinylchloridicum]
MTRRLLARTAVGVGLVELFAAVLVFGVATDSARAFGLSLVFPGGGLLYTAHPIAFLFSVVLLVVALVLWWGISAHLAIPLVWLGSAIIAWSLVDSPRLFLEQGTTWPWSVPVVYLLAVMVAGTGLWKLESRFRAKRAKVGELNEYLASVELPSGHPGPREPDAVDAELVRWCYDLAQQPHDGLKGFDWGEQFHGGTQLRYQVFSYCWAMCIFAANYVPNGQRQAREALTRMVLKNTDLRVWGYWRTLNLLGNFSADPDPIKKDNIMFSGFLGDVLGNFEAATGSAYFDQPGSLNFVWKDGREFPYDHHSIIEAVQRNFENSRLGFFPCEPGWSFTVCNIFAAQGMYGHDKLHGTTKWADYKDRWRRTLDEEYLTPDGSYSHIRSNLTGLSWDTGEMPGGAYHAHASGRFIDILPGHYRRALALDLKEARPMMDALSSMVVDGKLDLELPREPDRHRQTSTAVTTWTKLIGGAALVGDETLARAAIAGADAQLATGARWPERPLDGSAASIGGFLVARWSAPLSLGELNIRGYVPPTGPLLIDTAWDDVLVVLARSTDGRSLDLALTPSGEHDLPDVGLTLEALEPHRCYTVTNLSGDSEREVAEFIADADGRAVTSVAVTGFTRLRLEPTDSGKA